MKTIIGLICILILVTGCTRTIATISKTEPIVTSTTKPIKLRSNKILVVTPTSFQQASSEFTQEAKNSKSNATSTRDGVFTSLDYNALGTAIEGDLINNNWHPISQSIIAKVSFGTAYKELMDSFKAQGTYNLLQTALIVGKEVNSDYILVVKNAKFYSDPDLKSQSTDALFFAETAILDSATAEVVWSNKISIRPTDLINTDLTTKPFLVFGIVENEYGAFNCRANGPCEFRLTNRNRFSDKAIEIASRLITSSIPQGN